MSDEKRKHEGIRWLETARNDFEAALILKKHGKYSLACFHAQQAAEKALKALFYSMEDEPWGHSIGKLLDQARKDYPKHKVALASLEVGAKRLDQFYVPIYVPTRYPNGVPDMTPDEAFGEEDAKNGAEYAEKFLKTMKKMLNNA
jgi:HEPN domain-containing protein